MTRAMEIKKSVCFWCKGECGVLVKTQGDRLLGIEKDPDFPRDVFPKMASCPRARRAKEYIYHSDRLRYPLKRTGERGGAGWKVINWNQAFDEIAVKLSLIKKEFGAEALVGYHGTHRTHREYMFRFFNNFGSPNITGTGNICALPRRQVAYALVGNFPFYNVSPGKTKCIVLLGLEPDPARPFTYHKIREARKAGVKIIVIDPRKTMSAAKADLWLPLRHGTDPALLLGMANIIIQEDLYDHDFVKNWCHGFDDVVERVKDYTLEKVSAITGLPPEDIRKAALMYANNKPGSICEGMGIEQSRNCTAGLHARWILSAITGDIDVEGGEELRPQQLPNVISNSDTAMNFRLPEKQRKKQLGKEFKLFSYEGQEVIKKAMEPTWGKGKAHVATEGHPPAAWRAIITGEPYPVKALIVDSGNPMVTQANTRLIYNALTNPNLELSVVADFFMTPTAALADYVLPVACWLERPSITFPHSDQPYMTAGVTALPHFAPGEYDYKRDFDIFRELGVRLGQKDAWPWDTLEEAYDYRVKPAGYDNLEEFVEKVRFHIPPPEFKKYERLGFGTPTRKVELFSTIFEKMGYDPLPRYDEPHETVVSTPDIAKKYPLTLLTGGRTKWYYHSEWRQIWSIREKHPYPLLQIHHKTAKSLKIEEGDWVWIESIRGKIKAVATLSEMVGPEVVHVEHGWWLPELPGEAPWLHGVWEVNCNVLGDDDPKYCDPITGGWGLKTILCKVYKARSFVKK